jgi:hypothetical protein
MSLNLKVCSFFLTHPLHVPNLFLHVLSDDVPSDILQHAQITANTENLSELLTSICCHGAGFQYVSFV